MNMFEQHQAQMQAGAASYDTGLRQFLLGVYNYMSIALVVTALFAYAVANTPEVIGALYRIEGDYIVGTTMLGMIVMFAPLAFVLALSFGINRMSVGTSQLVFWIYSAVMGVSLASIAFMYTGESLTRVFLVTAIMFGGMSLFGYTTKRDLTGVGHFMIMGLLGLIVASLINIWLQSSALYWTLSIIGIVVFVGLTAYDTQKLKATYYQVAGNSELAAKASIMGALTLYLDFINLFLYMLRFMGDRR